VPLELQYNTSIVVFNCNCNTMGTTAHWQMLDATRPRPEEHPSDDLLLRRVAHVRRLAAEHLVAHTRQRVHIAARRDLLLGRGLLGTHVVRRTEREARLRHPPAGRRAYRERNAEVGHHRPAVRQQDVLRLDIAMDHPVAVRVMQRVGHLAPARARGGSARPGRRRGGQPTMSSRTPQSCHEFANRGRLDA
jgi:hypothetical protein